MDIVNAILGVVTIVGTLFGIISYADSKNSKKELEKYTYLFDLAEKNIDKKLTLEEIQRLHDEKKEMDKIVKEEIPRQARITVLYDRLKADEEYLSMSYNRYVETKKEYEKLQSENEVKIPQNILDEIEHQILPDYLIKEQKQKYMSMLTIISYATAFLSIIPFLGIFSNFSIIATIYPLVCIIKLEMPKDKNERKKYIINLIFIGLIVLLSLFTLISGYLFFFEHWLNPNVEMLFYISFSLLIIFVILVVIRQIKNTINKNNH